MIAVIELEKVCQKKKRLDPVNEESARMNVEEKGRGDNEERYRNGERKRTISAISVQKSPCATPLHSYSSRSNTNILISSSRYRRSVSSSCNRLSSVEKEEEFVDKIK